MRLCVYFSSHLLDHFDQTLLVDLEQPPALLQREIAGAAAFVELDGGFVPLGHDELQTAAATLHRHLGEKSI